MAKFLTFLLFIGTLIFVSLFIIGGYSYEKFSTTFPASFSATQQVEFYLPQLNNWDPINQKENSQTTSVEYYLDSALQEFQGGYESVFVTIGKAKRTAPFTGNEIAETETLNRGEIRYSRPAISKDGNYATILFTKRGLDGFYTLKAPVNFSVQCATKDPKKIVAAVMATFGVQKSSTVSDMSIRMKSWWIMRTLEWPDQTSSCF